MAVNSSTDWPWFVTQRWQQYEGEVRANLLRIAALGTFYLLHLWNYYSSRGWLPDVGFLQMAGEGEVAERFHLLVTLVTLAWVMLAAAVHMALRSRVFPGWLPTASTVGDLVFLTSLLCIASGPRSPLIVAYFLIIALAALRFSLPLVRVATVGAALGYLVLLACAKWPERFGFDPEVDRQVPRFEQVIFLAAVALSGIFIGQVIRRVRHMAEEYADRLESSAEEAT